MNITHKMLKEKKADTNEYVLHDFIYIKFKNRQNQSLVLEIVMQVANEEEGIRTEEPWRVFPES